MISLLEFKFHQVSNFFGGINLEIDILVESVVKVMRIIPTRDNDFQQIQS